MPPDGVDVDGGRLQNVVKRLQRRQRPLRILAPLFVEYGGLACQLPRPRRLHRLQDEDLYPDRRGGLVHE